MKKVTRNLLLAIWVFLATLVLTFFWGNNPELFFKPPESFSNWLADVYGVTNAEELGDLELLYVFVCSIIIVSIVTAGAFIVNKIITRHVK